MNKYGKRLKELREQRGYSQDELAKLLNTSRSRIGMYEQGRRQPDFEMQETIADLFNVTIDYLFGREEEKIKSELNKLNVPNDEMAKALDFYSRYKKIPEVSQQAIQVLLSNGQPDPESPDSN